MENALPGHRNVDDPVEARPLAAGQLEHGAGDRDGDGRRGPQTYPRGHVERDVDAHGLHPRLVEQRAEAAAELGVVSRDGHPVAYPDDARALRRGHGGAAVAAPGPPRRLVEQPAEAAAELGVVSRAGHPVAYPDDARVLRARYGGRSLLESDGDRRHAVVYGVPAIAVGLEKGATAVARAEDPGVIRIGDRMAGARDNAQLGRGFGGLLDEAAGGAGGGDGSAAVAPAECPGVIRIGDRMAVARDNSELGRGFGALLDEAGVESVSVDVTLDVPPGVGLGASAAIAVAVSRAVLELTRGERPGLDRIVDVAMAWERIFHGNPSGVDAWAAAHGGCVLFKPGSGIKPIRGPRRISLPLRVAR